MSTCAATVGLAAEVLTIAHNDLEALERVCRTGKRVAYVCDGVYSMGGSAPIAKLQALQDRYGLFLCIDDAHGVSIFGERGEGFARSQIAGPLGENTIIAASLALENIRASRASATAMVTGPGCRIHGSLRGTSRAASTTSTITFLMNRVRSRVSDRRVVRLIGRFLNVGVMAEEQFVRTEAGTPQGGIISKTHGRNIFLLLKFRSIYMSFWSKSKERYRARKCPAENASESTTFDEFRHARTKSLIFAEAAVKYV